jgi:hypothetical protein
VSPDIDRGELLARFQVDPREERSFARIRLASALLGALGSAALLLGRLPVGVFMIGVLGLLVSLAWLRQARKAKVRAAQAGDHHLVVYKRGLLLAEGDTQTWLAWSDVRAVEVDEERLDIVLERSGGTVPPLRIEPRYPGVEIHELMRTLRNAWLSSSDP